MHPTDVELMEMAPPEMPAALYANQVDAYATGEPFGAVAEVDGYAPRPLHDARQVAELRVAACSRCARTLSTGTGRWCSRL